MAHVEDTMGAQLQGVSQQPARLRTEGQVGQQDNYDSDVASGLTSRPGTTQIAFSLAGALAATKYEPIEYKGVPYILGYSTGSLLVWRMDGTALTMGGPMAYIGADMVFAPDDSNGWVMCVNRDTNLAMSSAPAAGRAFNAGVVTCLGGLFSRTYSVTVTVGSDTITFEYTTPDGSLPAHATDTSSTAIAGGLKTAFDALSLPAGLTGMTTTVSESTLLIEFSAAMSISVDDGEDGVTLRAISDFAKDITHLPETAKHGHVVQIQGGPATEDDYYLQFTSDTTSTLGAGFGDPGVWREVADPDVQNALDLATMPHQLVIDDDAGTATLSTLAWEDRRVGDETTNPTPDYIGFPMRDVHTFEKRTVFVAAGRFNSSRTESPLDLWKKSATTEAAGDPISIRSTSAVGGSLDWIVPFDRDLLLVSDGGKAQFVVTGGGLTPANASMVLTTEYNVVSGVRPVSTGRTIILPYRTGTFVGINEFFTNDVVSTNGADPLTAAQDKYIPGNVTALRSAENFNRFALTADGDNKTIWFYRFLWSAQERLQSAWYKLKFTDDVKGMFFDDTNLYVILHPTGFAAGTATLVRMDLNRTDDDVGFHITLDRREDQTVLADNKVQVRFPNARVVQRAGCSAPGLLGIASEVDLGGGLYELTLDEDQCPVGATVTTGQSVLRELEPTPPITRSRDGAVVSNALLYIKAYLVHLLDSGTVKGTIKSPYRDDLVLEQQRFPLDDEPLDPNRTGVLSRVMRVPARERTDRHTLVVSSTDIRPNTVVEIEWMGDLRNLRRRLS